MSSAEREYQGNIALVTNAIGDEDFSFNSETLKMNAFNWILFLAVQE
ncbi:MAG: hypothetical protein PF505_04050 [Vallitaleaceae bacterium]|jgi:hypothetical protein|nr:hypothetical protein [Vallitaleaceae bacterium]